MGMIRSGDPLQAMLRNLMSCAPDQKAQWRQRIVGLLTTVDNPVECIDELLSRCITQGGPDGLDMAIDILAKTDNIVLDYAGNLRRDPTKWMPESDDLWYILLRVVARINVEANLRFDFIKCFSLAESRGIREGVVEGMGDLGTPEAKELLKTLAHYDSDEYIRKIAGEVLAGR